MTVESVGSAKTDAKLLAVLTAAADVFARYGFKRTTLADIADAAGISRPALYLLFKNKEDLFKQLAGFRQNGAIDAAIAELALRGSFTDRLSRAVVTYERLFYEPVSQSPHGEELMDANLSIAGDDMRTRSRRIVGALAKATVAADEAGEIQLKRAGVGAKDFVELMMASVNGQKREATSTADFRKRVANVVAIFCASIAAGDSERPKRS